MSKATLIGNLQSTFANYIILEVGRDSGAKDLVPIKTEFRFEDYKTGDMIKVEGTVRTRNFYDSYGKRHKEMYILPTVITPKEEADDLLSTFFGYENCLTMEGYLCKKDVLRKTPAGKTILDFIIAVNHDNGQSSYISCIAWNKTAEWLNTIGLGNKLQITGRFQSRVYEKDGHSMLAYEICSNRISLVRTEK